MSLDTADKLLLQGALKDHPQHFYTGEIDGKYGVLTHQAVQRAEDYYGLPISPPFDPANVHVPEELLYVLGVWKRPPKFTLFTLIGLVGPVLTLLKGNTTMLTTDQIGGVVRAILTFLAGLAVARGWVDNETAMTVIGGIVTVATALWSLHTNRAEKIVPK